MKHYQNKHFYNLPSLTNHFPLSPRKAARETMETEKKKNKQAAFASNWKQCNTSDTVGQDIASQRSRPEITKNGYKKELVS